MMWTAIKSRLTGQSCVFLSITTVMLRTLHEPSLCLLWEGWAPAGSCYVFACRSQWVPQHSVQEAKLADWLGCTPPTPPLSHLLFPPPLCLFLRRGAHVPSLLSIFFFLPSPAWSHTWNHANMAKGAHMTQEESKPALPLMLNECWFCVNQTFFLSVHCCLRC